MDDWENVDYKTFEFVKTLGKGTHGTVILAQQQTSKKKYAIKSIMKQSFNNEKQLSLIKREVEIMASLSHMHIITVYDVCESSSRVTMTLEYASGGELFDYVNESPGGLEESEVRRIFGQISSAVQYLHKKGIVHRDLKLENILLDCDRNAKICDFGLANVYSRDKLLFTYCGSPLYAAPEIIKTEPYFGPEVDCWSLGVILYAMSFGELPFDGSDVAKLRKSIINGEYVLPPRAKPLLTDLISQLLEPITERRLLMKEVIAHPWLNKTKDVTSTWPYFDHPSNPSSPSSSSHHHPYSYDASMRNYQNHPHSDDNYSACHQSPKSNYYHDYDNNHNGASNPYPAPAQKMFPNYGLCGDADGNFSGYPDYLSYESIEKSRSNFNFYNNPVKLEDAQFTSHNPFQPATSRRPLRPEGYQKYETCTKDEMAIVSDSVDLNLVRCPPSKPMICEVENPRKILLFEDEFVVCDRKTSSISCLNATTCNVKPSIDVVTLPRSKSEPNDLTLPRMKSCPMFSSCYIEMGSKTSHRDSFFRDGSVLEDSLNPEGIGYDMEGVPDIDSLYLRKLATRPPDSLESMDIRIMPLYDLDNDFSFDSLDS